MSEEFDKALEKLWIHGGAVVDFAENISRGQDHWRELYIAQGERKKQQLELMHRYAESSQCRMAALVRHFGDLTDARKPCGKCDFCAPSDSIGQRFRPATAPEILAAARILAGLRSAGARATGKLHSELCPQGELSRDAFEEVLGALARAGLVRLAEAVFEKNGKAIPYRKASLTAAGDAMDERSPIELLMKDDAAAKPLGKRKKRRSAEKKAARPALKRSRAEAPAGAAGVEEALRGWRREEARRRGVPAFRIFSDRALQAIAARRPSSAAELLAIPGIGIGTVEKHGAQIYRILGAGP
jgi:superfamily II DNA helicase RecQ